VPSLLALMMHGEVKMRFEGLRTRDAHLLECLSQTSPDLDVLVHSRPEPWPRVSVARWRGARLPSSWRMQSPQPVVVPLYRDKRQWWVKSERYAAAWPAVNAVLIWNPIAGAAQIGSLPPTTPTIVDLLDDWSGHHAFRSIHKEVNEAYRVLFARSDVVTANSEATLSLAQSFGRPDAKLIRNGCDPTRFEPVVDAHDRFTVGYGGKIGHRLDTALVRRAALRFPHWTFEFVGPVLVSRTKACLCDLRNVTFAGDVPYNIYPSALRRWDVAWVPHLTGAGEVGGDVIKIYEYRAAGLPVVIPKIIGWERALPGVVVADPPDLLDSLATLAGPGVAMSVKRDRYDTPESDTWRFKSDQMLGLLGLGGS
jgi:glycosyltransferase involved in cell wall biosynthesis